MNWTKTGKTTKANGESTVYYVSDVGRYLIESRKRAVPHSNREGSWMHTTYFLVRPDGTETEHMSLLAAKSAAEQEVQRNG